MVKVSRVVRQKMNWVKKVARKSHEGFFNQYIEDREKSFDSLDTLINSLIKVSKEHLQRW